MTGERHSQQIPFEALKLAAGVVILSPYIPMLFMGEEYGEDSPFVYFIDHADPGLIEAVRRGRREEFKAFQWQGELPDPKAPETFSQCKLKRGKRGQGPSRVLLDFYQRLIQLRKDVPALGHLTKEGLEVGSPEKRLLFGRRRHGKSQVWFVMNFGLQEVVHCIKLEAGRWRKLLDSAEEQWMGPGSSMPRWCESGQCIAIPALSFALYEKEEAE
jgi:maltooligosyltrehalose trehalohydrolase